MRFEDVAQCNAGRVLCHTPSKRPAVLLAVFGKPLYSITIQYLDGDTARIDGCSMKYLELGELKAGTLLQELSGGQKAMLVENSTGPSVTVLLIGSGKRKTADLCQPQGKRMCAAFVIAPPPKGTVPHNASPQ